MMIRLWYLFLTFYIVLVSTKLCSSLTVSPSVENSKISLASLRNKRILVVGGSGRVGGSCVAELSQRGAKVTVGGTSSDRFLTAKTRWLSMFPGCPELQRVDFAELNREQTDSVQAVLQSNKFDLVVNTAGPFQGKVNVSNGVLEASVQAGVSYIDVCDDYSTASAAKSKFADLARNNNVPCIISTGCWPGISSLMAKQLIFKTFQTYPDLKPQNLSVNFSFFTAGSGGAGVTLLVATFLILAEKALTVVNGQRRPVDAMKQYTRVNFGPVVGDKEVAHLNLLETASVADILGAGSVQALFGTAPGFWNALLGAMAHLPSSILANEEVMRKLSLFSMPVVRLVDFFAGATNAMRCDVTSSQIPTLRATAIYAHDNLEPCVGQCVTAFCAAVLSQAVTPGVWFPEEAIQEGDDAVAVLQAASVGAHTTIVEAEGMQLATNDIWG